MKIIIYFFSCKFLTLICSIISESLCICNEPVSQLCTYEDMNINCEVSYPSQEIFDAALKPGHENVLKAISDSSQLTDNPLSISNVTEQHSGTDSISKSQIFFLSFTYYFLFDNFRP